MAEAADSADLRAQRFSRQTRFAPIGSDGQAKIEASHVVMVGCGALGTHLAETMVRAGVAKLTIIDRDFVESSNLQRQGLFTEADADQHLPKAIAAQTHLSAISSLTEIDSHVTNLDSENAEDLLEEADLILDATDNFETRLLINDLAIKTGIPWIYAACVGSCAMAMPILPGRSACFACLMEELPGAGGETCETSGIIMPAVLAAVSKASAMALQILSGHADHVPLKLQIQDLWLGASQQLNAQTPNPDCRACAKREFGFLSGRLGTRALSLCGRNAVQLFPNTRKPLVLDEVEAQLSGAYQISKPNPHLLEVFQDDYRLTLFADGRALVTGTTDIAKARAITARVLGV